MITPKTLKDIKITTTFVTHNGDAHCDDLMATLLLGLFTYVNHDLVQQLDDDVLTNDVLKILHGLLRLGQHDPIIDQIKEDGGKVAILYDIGLGEFDHHQKDARLRADDRIYDKRGECKYSACSLLWNRYGHEWIITTFKCDNWVASKAWIILDRILQAIDRQDNYGPVEGYSSVSDVFVSYDMMNNPDRNFNISVENMWKVVLFPLIKRMIKTIKDYQNAEKYADLAVSGIFINYDPIKGGSLVNIPAACFNDTGVNYVIGPSKNNPGEFNLISICPGVLPSFIMQGVDGCTFVHQSRFMAAFESLERAKNAAFKCVFSEEK